jgi:hypothetical protein
MSFVYNFKDLGFFVGGWGYEVARGVSFAQ